MRNSIKRDDLHHVKDAHEFHLWDWNDKAIFIPLPIILWTNDGLITFKNMNFTMTTTVNR